MATYRGLQKISHKKKRHHIPKIKRRWIIIPVCILAVFVSLLIYFTSERYRVSEISLTGLAQTPEADVREYLDVAMSQKKFIFLPANVLWLINSAALENGLKERFPTIQSVKIQKEFPNTFRVGVTEFNGWGVLCHGDPEECFWIDRGGMAFDHAPGFSGLIVPKIRDLRNRNYQLGERQLSDKMMQIVTYFDEHAVSNKYLQSLQFTIDATDQTLRVTTRAGWDILLLESNDPAVAYKNLTVALDGEIKDKVSNLSYIDLRFGNRIFYKFRE